MNKGVLIFQGLFELVGIIGFIVGFLGDITWLTILGGCLLLIDDIIEVIMGILNPIFPIVLAVILAVILSPWYVGIFWASAAFKILNIPGSITKVFAPEKIISRAHGIDTDNI